MRVLVTLPSPPLQSHWVRSIISGPTEDCDDVGQAFDADRLVMGSIDCDCSVFVGDMNPDDIDDEMMTTERLVPAMPVVIR
mmetsp:Transcript_22691/g.24177  ORF Transcript_22691/g.24177 Transcript_22691/m.24177 type:complete len:81 (+) Transcript_22691:492-734(+)